MCETSTKQCAVQEAEPAQPLLTVALSLHKTQGHVIKKTVIWKISSFFFFYFTHLLSSVIFTITAHKNFSCSQVYSQCALFVVLNPSSQL